MEFDLNSYSTIAILTLIALATGVEIGVLKKRDGLNSIISFIIGGLFGAFFLWRRVDGGKPYREEIERLEVLVDALEAIKINE